MDKEKAVEAANNHIGVTWDVGHINMIRKFGYDQSDVVKETKKVADMVKHVHLSDNFGFEHTELPMGMGNVPTKEHLEAIGEKVKKMKKLLKQEIGISILKPLHLHRRSRRLVHLYTR